jgi:pimeloyl-ACP methyl ester carboxylesterase
VSSFTSYDGVRLAYDSLGEGHPLVCVPGGPGRAVGYLEDLGGVSATRTLLLLDPRATGHSEVPPDPASLRFDRMADDLEAFREHLLLERLDLLAHSAGCLVAQAWASRHPDRVGRLVLVTPSDGLQGGTRADVPAIRQSFADQPWYADAAAAQAALEDAPPSQRAGLEREARPFSYARWDQRAQTHAAGADHQCSKRAMLGFAAGVEDIDLPALVAGLQQVRAPVTVIGGYRDGMTGVGSCYAVAASFPQARTVILPDAGHYPWVDQPEAFAAAVREAL